MKANELFNGDILEMTVEELIVEIDALLDEHAPEGKSHKDFTGGYVQQLKNSNQLVAYYGTKQGQKNRDTVKMEVEANELDDMYIMLKAKIHSMKSSQTKTVRVSLAQRRLAKKELARLSNGEPEDIPF